MAVVNPVPQERTPPGLEELYGNLKKEFGRVLNFAKVMAHRPDALKAFFHFYATAVDQGTIEPRYKQLAYLKASLANGCRYCIEEHTALAKGTGVSVRQIGEIDSYQFSSAFSEKEKATLAYAEQVTRDARSVRESDLEKLRRHYTEDEIVELTLVICIANCGNRFSQALHIPLG